MRPHEKTPHSARTAMKAKAVTTAIPGGAAPAGMAGFPARVGLVARDPLRVVGFQSLFEQHPTIEIVALPVAELLKEERLRLALVAEQDTERLLDLLAAFRSFRPDIRVIAMGKAIGSLDMQAVMSAGAKAYLGLNASEAEIVEAIEAVRTFGAWASQRPVLRPAKAEPAADLKSHPQEYRFFTPRERQVLDLLVTGLSNLEIGRSLKIAERTVKYHIGSLMRKVGVHNRTALSMHALTRIMPKASR